MVSPEEPSRAWIFAIEGIVLDAQARVRRGPDGNSKVDGWPELLRTSGEGRMHLPTDSIQEPNRIETPIAPVRHGAHGYHPFIEE